MQARAAEDLRKLVTDRLVDAGLLYEGAKAFVTPRRLALAIEGIPVKQPDIREEKKGPRVGAPEAAIAGFRAGVLGDRIAFLDQFTKGFFSAGGELRVSEAQRRYALDIAAFASPKGTLDCISAFGRTDQPPHPSPVRSSP